MDLDAGRRRLLSWPSQLSLAMSNLVEHPRRGQLEVAGGINSSWVGWGQSAILELGPRARSRTPRSTWAVVLARCLGGIAFAHLPLKAATPKV